MSDAQRTLSDCTSVTNSQNRAAANITPTTSTPSTSAHAMAQPNRMSAGGA